MSSTIDTELTKFKENVANDLESMNTTYQLLVDGISKVQLSNEEFKDSFSRSYKSKNKSSIMSSFTRIGDNFTSVDNDVSSNLKVILNGSQTIVTYVNELEGINRKIDSQNSIITSESNKEEPNNSVISNARSTIDSLNKEFNTKHEEAKRLLNELKAKDTALSEELSKEAESQANLENLKHGKLVRKKFKASNGTVITYMVYVPDYGEDVDNLPINMYMHGSGMGENDASRLTQSGLGRLISDKTITPSGIVVLPLAPSGRAYESKGFRDALAELPLQVADDYNADKDRISLSGHSYGAIEAYKLVNEHPDEFSAIVPVSGSNKVTSAFNNVKVWAFHGTADSKTKNTSYKQASDAMKEINQVGGDAEIHAYDGWGHAGDSKHNIVVTTFKNEFTKDGEKINPLEWAFQQSKSA